MLKISLSKIKPSDIEYFSTWWRDKALLKLTSGVLKFLSPQEIYKYFQAILKSKTDYHFMIIANKKTIGHISLAKRQNNWYETQIVVGDKKYWGKGCGQRAIMSLLGRAKHFKISKIYLEVRPTNMRAIRTYKKCGFRKTKIIQHPQNKSLPETLRMELKRQ